jgi:uroporphyrinogen-III decarboxylase
MDFQKPDRIPRRDIFEGPFIEKWKESGGTGNIYANYGKIDVQDTFRPFGREGILFSKKGIVEEKGNEQYFRDDWGRVLRTRPGGESKQVISYVLADKAELDSLPVESGRNPERLSGILPGLAERKEREALFAGIMGLFMACQNIRGITQFPIDMIEDPPFAGALVEKILSHRIETALYLLETADLYKTGLWIYDELAMTGSLWISPDTFEAVLLPAYKKLISSVKKSGARHVVLHCDGYSEPLWDMLIDAGFTGIQSCNPNAGMDLPRMKKKYGGSIVLVGGIDNVNVLRTGPASAIEKQVIPVLEAASDGGVVVGPHSVAADIPVAHYELYYRTVSKFDEQRM